MRKKRHMLIGMILVGAFLLTGCTAVGPDPMRFQNEGFYTEIEGELAGKYFYAAVTVGQASGIDGSGREVSVSFLPGSSFAGLTLAAVCTTDGRAIGEICVTYRGIGSLLHADSAQGLLEVAVALLALSDHETVQSENGKYVLTFSGERTLFLREDGVPISYTSPRLCFTVRMWEAQKG